MGFRQNIIALSLLIFCVFFSSENAIAKPTCALLFQDSSRGLAKIEVGPRRQNLSESILKKGRKANSSFYNYSKLFASVVGQKFVDLVRSRIPAKGKIAIVVAMGGAEHLGTLLEYSLALQKVEGVEIQIHYIDMNRNHLNAWEATRSTDTIGTKIIRTGIGMPPEGYHLLVNPKDRGRFGAHFSPIAEEIGLFNSDKVIVIDTGFRGTTVEAVRYIGDSFDFDGPVEGVLLSHSPGTENTMPVFSLNQTLKVHDLIAQNWAWAIDENLTYGDRPILGVHQARTFFRSSQVNAATANPALYEQRLEKYQETLAGLIDGLISGSVPKN